MAERYIYSVSRYYTDGTPVPNLVKYRFFTSMQKAIDYYHAIGYTHIVSVGRRFIQLSDHKLDEYLTIQAEQLD